MSCESVIRLWHQDDNNIQKKMFLNLPRTIVNFPQNVTDLSVRNSPPFKYILWGKTPNCTLNCIPSSHAANNFLIWHALCISMIVYYIMRPTGRGHCHCPVGPAECRMPNGTQKSGKLMASKCRNDWTDWSEFSRLIPLSGPHSHCHCLLAIAIASTWAAVGVGLSTDWFPKHSPQSVHPAQKVTL